MIRVFAVLIVATLLAAEATASGCVILLHGLARSDSSMKKMEKALNKAGYNAVNVSYPSTEKEIPLLANESIPKALEKCPNGADISFVTHSMGGILIRQYLSEKAIPKLKHVVMLGPPNQGSEVVDKLKDVPGFKSINGPAGLQLGTSEMSVPNSLGPATFSLGIIAGTRSINLMLSTIIPSKDDGKVSVERTKLEGMDDHISMPVTHTFMMKNKKVIKQVLYFLEYGNFQREHNQN